MSVSSLASRVCNRDSHHATSWTFDRFLRNLYLRKLVKSSWEGNVAEQLRKTAQILIRTKVQSAVQTRSQSLLSGWPIQTRKKKVCDPSLNIQSCIKRPFRCTFKFENSIFKLFWPSIPKKAFFSLLCSSTYSRLRNKHRATLINFWKNLKKKKIKTDRNA